MLPPDQRSKVTLEDLLRLKRAERPPEEFWSTFERELRQKQLSALMEKRSWWQEIPILLSRRAYLPVGATAILAFTLVSVKFYNPHEIAQFEVPVSASSSSGLAAEASGNQIPTEIVGQPVSSPLVNRHESALEVAENSAPDTPTSAAPVATGRIEVLPMLNAAQVETPSSRSIAANLARLQQSEPELLDAVLGARLSPSSDRVSTEVAPVAEFASVPTSSSPRSRLLAQYSDRQVEPEPTVPAIVRERHARRLADNEVNDRFTRVGLRGDQVSLRF